MCPAEDLKFLMEKECNLKTKNEFLVSALQKKRKVTLSEEMKNVDISSIKDILVKKLLEYREVRNYSTTEMDEEKMSFLKLKINCNEFEQKVIKLSEKIKKKQYSLMQFYSTGSVKLNKTLQELVARYSSLLIQVCSLIADKAKINVKLLKIKERNNRKATISGEFVDFEYNNLLSKKKELEDRFFKKKREINERKEKLDQTVTMLAKVKHQSITYLRKNKILSKRLQPKVEMVQKVGARVNSLKDTVAKMRKEVELLEKKAGLQGHEELIADCRTTSVRTGQLKEQLEQSEATYKKIMFRQNTLNHC